MCVTFLAGAVLGEGHVLLFVAGAVLGEVLVAFYVAGAVLGESQVLLFLAGAVLGEGLVSLFVAGAVLGKVLVSLFVAGAVLGGGQVSPFVAGAALGEGLNVKIGWETLYFTIENVPADIEKKLHLRGRLWFAFLSSDCARIMVGSAPHWKWHWKWRFSCFPQISARCWVVILRGRRSNWWVWRVTFIGPCIVNQVSYVTRMNHVCHFSWQVQYLVKVKCYFSW